MKQIKEFSSLKKILSVPLKQVDNRIVLKGVHKIDMDNIHVPLNTEKVLSKGLGWVPTQKQDNKNIMENWKDFERQVLLKRKFHDDTSENMSLNNPKNKKIKVKSDWVPDEYYKDANNYLSFMKLSLAQIINEEEHENSGTGHEENISKEEKIALTYLKKHKNKDFLLKQRIKI